MFKGALNTCTKTISSVNYRSYIQRVDARTFQETVTHLAQQAEFLAPRLPNTDLLRLPKKFIIDLYTVISVGLRLYYVC